ncbi:MAG: hypothetical protein ABSH51_09395 [Solirubrobacteraceae bacterium]|jgi:hypothetical protein
MSVQPIIPGAVVSRIWAIYRAQAVPLIGTAIILFALQFVFELLIPSASVAVAILFWALSTLYQGMVVELVRDIEAGQHQHSVSDLISSVYPVLLPLMGVSVLYAAGVAIGFILFIIPGLMLMVIWAVVAPITILERPGVLLAFSRSRELVRGNGMNVFGVIAMVYVAVLVISLAASLASSSLGTLGTALVQWVVIAALAPVSALSASVLYFALRG